MNNDNKPSFCIKVSEHPDGKLPYGLKFSRLEIFKDLCLALKILQILLLNILVLQRCLLKLISSLRFKLMAPLVINILS